MEAIRTGARRLGASTIRPEPRYIPNSAWCTPFVGGSYEFLDNGVRLLDARSFMFFYATGITPAMAWRVAVSQERAVWKARSAKPAPPGWPS